MALQCVISWTLFIIAYCTCAIEIDLTVMAIAACLGLLAHDNLVSQTLDSS